MARQTGKPRQLTGFDAQIELCRKPALQPVDGDISGHPIVRPGQVEPGDTDRLVLDIVDLGPPAQGVAQCLSRILIRKRQPGGRQIQIPQESPHGTGVTLQDAIKGQTGL